MLQTNPVSPSGIDLGNALDIASAVIALASAVIAIVFSIKTIRDSRLNQHLQLSGLKQQYFSELLPWAKEVVMAMSDAISLCYLDPKKLPKDEFFHRRHLLYSKLSALMDQGRWFFPNLQHVEHGQTKEKAFRGIRQEVLNAIEATLRLLVELNYMGQADNKTKAPLLVEQKRIFVSEIQEIVDPRKRGSEFKQLTQITSKDLFKP